MKRIQMQRVTAMSGNVIGSEVFKKRLQEREMTENAAFIAASQAFLREAQIQMESGVNPNEVYQGLLMAAAKVLASTTDREQAESVAAVADVNLRSLLDWMYESGNAEP